MGSWGKGQKQRPIWSLVNQTGIFRHGLPGSWVGTGRRSGRNKQRARRLSPLYLYWVKASAPALAFTTSVAFAPREPYLCGPDYQTHPS